jgi:hypothetical protein
MLIQARKLNHIALLYLLVAKQQNYFNFLTLIIDS